MHAAALRVFCFLISYFIAMLQSLNAMIISLQGYEWSYPPKVKIVIGLLRTRPVILTGVN